MLRKNLKKKLQTVTINHPYNDLDIPNPALIEFETSTSPSVNANNINTEALNLGLNE